MGLLLAARWVVLKNTGFFFLGCRTTRVRAAYVIQSSSFAAAFSAAACLLRRLLHLFRNVCGTPIVTVIIHLHTHKRQQNIITLHTHKRQQNIITLNLYDKEWVVHNNNNNNYNNNYNSNNNRETNRARWWSSKRSAHCNITPSFFTHVPATGLVTAGLTHCAVV